jgi:hypothetical protein
MFNLLPEDNFVEPLPGETQDPRAKSADTHDHSSKERLVSAASNLRLDPKPLPGSFNSSRFGPHSIKIRNLPGFLSTDRPNYRKAFCAAEQLISTIKISIVDT